MRNEEKQSKFGITTLEKMFLNDREKLIVLIQNHTKEIASNIFLLSDAELRQMAQIISSTMKLLPLLNKKKTKKENKLKSEKSK